jgi:hypothetical protein
MLSNYLQKNGIQSIMLTNPFSRKVHPGVKFIKTIFGHFINVHFLKKFFETQTVFLHPFGFVTRYSLS